ncbi:hypothetical protein BDA96_09G096800 [Sorghum bicolor]|uniref:Uncharacterized protein n=2 Tax=Sorghum bicolor TaxID=4558 RepID=A0A921U3M8_SORBI|nr:hypothetical protein BDA96_09G096800 [Sorghum bicolor]OQU77711.1 hypothetical protein SORBI_3009G092060 [Sorghum bicolor]
MVIWNYVCHQKRYWSVICLDLCFKQMFQPQTNLQMQKALSLPKDQQLMFMLEGPKTTQHSSKLLMIKLMLKTTCTWPI